MAKVLAIVASVLAVAQVASQVADSIIKLKGYWDQVKEAPDDIQQLLLEIDLFNDILSHMQGDQASLAMSELTPNGAIIAVRKSLELCNKGAAQLNDLVEELSQKVNRNVGLRKVAGSVKVVLRKNEVKRQRRTMKSTIRLLSLTYQCHIGYVLIYKVESEKD